MSYQLIPLRTPGIVANWEVIQVGFTSGLRVTRACQVVIRCGYRSGIADSEIPVKMPPECLSSGASMRVKRIADVLALVILSVGTHSLAQAGTPSDHGSLAATSADDQAHAALRTGYRDFIFGQGMVDEQYFDEIKAGKPPHVPRFSYTQAMRTSEEGEETIRSIITDAYTAMRSNDAENEREIHALQAEPYSHERDAKMTLRFDQREQYQRDIVERAMTKLKDALSNEDFQRLDWYVRTFERVGTPKALRPSSSWSFTAHLRRIDTWPAIYATPNRTMIETVARDSSGRVCQRKQWDDGHTAVSIYDPTTDTTTSWWSDKKEATIRQLHTPQPNVPLSLRATKPVESEDSICATKSWQRNESLGTKTIKGLIAKGTRSSTCVPAHVAHNDEPQVLTAERWDAMDGALTVSEVLSAPWSDSYTVELTDIDFGAPDRGLFQIPEDYVIVRK